MVAARPTEPRPKEVVRYKLTCLIAFACYGCHLHGDESGSVDREHNLPGSRLIEASEKRVLSERKLMLQFASSPRALARVSAFMSASLFKDG